MQSLNLLVVFHPHGNQVLLCHRQKDPYKGLYNFVGGKVEPNESSEEAAYRELQEETGITPQEITLCHMMDMTYPLSDCKLEVYVGRLRVEKEVYGEENPLYWVETSENFFDSNRYAGEGNMGHILELVWHYGETVLPLPSPKN